MILRKPYALLIKNFKLIHVFLTLFSVFLLSKISNVLTFFDDYIANSGFIIEDYKVKELISGSLIFIIIIFIGINVLIAFMMKLKDKKILFYIYNIVFAIVSIILFSYVLTVLNAMQTRIVDTRTIRALRDFYVMLSGAGIVSILMYGMRATGFDLKKFDFKKELVELEVSEADNEEFEVAVNIDVNKIDRKRRKTLRNLKYLYFEHRYITNIIMGSVTGVIVIVTILYTLFSGSNVKKQYTLFSVSEYNLSINNAYVTNLDKIGNVIDETKSFVIVKIKIKKTNNKLVKLNTGRFGLVAGNHTYYHNVNYKDYFDDIGSAYTYEDLSEDYKLFTLIYRINSSDANKKFKINYFDGINTEVVNLTTTNLTSTKNNNFNIGEKFNFNNTILDKYEVSIDKYQIDEKIELKYTYKLNETDTVSAKEYIVPTISSNYDKAIMRIDYTFALPEAYNSYVVNMDMLLSRFGYLKYTIDGKEYTTLLNMGTLKSSKISQSNTTYLEIKKEVLKASKVVLGFKLRNSIYEATLKDGAE